MYIGPNLFNKFLKYVKKKPHGVNGVEGANSDSAPGAVIGAGNIDSTNRVHRYPYPPMGHLRPLRFRNHCRTAPRIHRRYAGSPPLRRIRHKIDCCNSHRRTDTNRNTIHRKMHIHPAHREYARHYNGRRPLVQEASHFEPMLSLVRLSGEFSFKLREKAGERRKECSNR